MSCDFSLNTNGVPNNGFQFTQSYVLGPSGEELTQFTVTAGVASWQRTNVYAAGKLLATYDAAGLHFHLTDPLGTRRMQLSGNLPNLGQPETDCQSLPFGDQLNCFPDPNASASGGDDATPLHFTGKERDQESGNDYFGARYYSSSVGRFMSPDWSAKEDPIPYAKLDNPQTLNLYAYVGNNPMSGIDPDGHFGTIRQDSDDACDANAAGSGCSKNKDDAFKVFGDPTAQQQTAQGLAAQIPGQVKTAIMNSVNASNAPSGADTTGGFHEEGGIAGTNTNGGLVISPATPGAYSSSGVVSTSLTPADPALAGSITNLTVSWHVHPDGRTSSGDLAWNQAPSGQDQKVAAAEHQALPGLIHIVVGAGNKQVYFYNGSSTVLQMSLKKFMAGAQ